MQIKRTPEFDLAYRFVTETNQNLFLTGKAGTGKTTFLKYLKANSFKNIVVAAPTGVAAINAGGVTLHSLFQLPFAPFVPSQRAGSAETVDSHSLLSQIRFHKAKLNLLRSLELLVIDEVSMVASHTMDAIDTILRSVRRRRNEPFGGVQVLFIGDLHQLPPVVKSSEWSILKEFYSSIFFFDSHVLRDNVPVMVELKSIYRQQDTNFINILNGIRNNNLSQENFNKLNSRLNISISDEEQEKEGFITLTTHNAQADSINSKKLQQIDSKTYTYEALVRGDFPEHAFPAEEKLELKVGAQVMFLKNDVEERQYFNGKIGMVTALDDDEIRVQCKGENHEITVRKDIWRNVRYSLDKNTREINEKELGSFEQYPLRLAWAITIHKSQGLTFDKLIVDAENAFANGQVYVALSRCTSLEGLVLTSPVNRQFLGAHQNLKEWQQQNHNEEELPRKFEQSRQQYMQHELLAIFEWKDWFFGLLNLENAIKEFQDDLPENSLAWIGQLSARQKELNAVAEKFRQQIRQLCQKNPNMEENELLQKRIKDAAYYFSRQLNDWMKQFSDHPLSVDTKKVSRKLDVPMKEINLSVQETLHRLEHCKQGFHLNAYLQKGKTLKDAGKVESTYGQQRAASTASGTTHTDLYNRLAEMRRQIGDAEDVPLYRIFSNQAIENVCEMLPGNTEALLQVKGFGKVKVRQYGEEVLDIVQDYCAENGLETQLSIEKPKKKKKKVKGQTLEETFALFEEGKNLQQIAEARGLANSTIEGHLAQLVEAGRIEIDQVIDLEEAKKIAEFFPDSLENISLTEIREKVPGDVSYGKLKMVGAWLQRERLGV